MEQINWYSVFYWLTVADNAKTFFLVFVIVFTLISGITTIAYFVNMGDGEVKGVTMSRRWMWWSYPFMILFWSLYIFTPTKRDALIIIAGGSVGNFITRDSSAKALPAEAMMLLRSKIKEEMKGATTISELVSGEVDTLKNKSKEELIKILKRKR